MSTSSSSRLFGTWRLLSYEVWDADGNVSAPKGTEPIGYAIFTSGGMAFIQLAKRGSAAPQVGDVEQRDELAASYVAYFGQFEHHPTKDEITISVEASNFAQYLGTKQVRPYTLQGTQLVLGIPGQYRACLERTSGFPSADA